MGTWLHGTLQFRVAELIKTAFPHYEPVPELTVRVTATQFLIPDIGVDRRDRRQDPYPVSPIHLCIEILSPGDRTAEVLAKRGTYHAWGTAHTWLIDPESRRAWQYTKGSDPCEVEELHAGDIHLRVADIFSVLD